MSLKWNRPAGCLLLFSKNHQLQNSSLVQIHLPGKSGYQRLLQVSSLIGTTNKIHLCWIKRANRFQKLLVIFCPANWAKKSNFKFAALLYYESSRHHQSVTAEITSQRKRILSGNISRA